MRTTTARTTRVATVPAARAILATYRGTGSWTRTPTVARVLSRSA